MKRIAIRFSIWCSLFSYLYYNDPGLLGYLKPNTHIEGDTCNPCGILGGKEDRSLSHFLRLHKPREWRFLLYICCHFFRCNPQRFSPRFNNPIRSFTFSGARANIVNANIILSNLGGQDSRKFQDRKFCTRIRTSIGVSIMGP